MVSVPSIERDGFRAVVSTTSTGGLQLSLQGFADVDIRDSLATLLQRLHEAALVQAIRTVDLDLAELEYLSSSCMRPLLRWLAGLREGGAPYDVSLVIRGSRYWQRRTAEALQGFAPSVVRFDETE